MSLANPTAFCARRSWSTPDAILHGGDINNQGILDTLASIAPVYVVRGNNDKEWAVDIPLFLDFQIGGAHIYMTHKKKDLPADLSLFDLVVVGHTHRYEEHRVGNTVLLNPGSCGPRRFNQAITMAMATVTPSASGKPMITVQRIDIETRVPEKAKPWITLCPHRQHWCRKSGEGNEV